MKNDETPYDKGYVDGYLQAVDDQDDGDEEHYAPPREKRRPGRNRQITGPRRDR